MRKYFEVRDHATFIPLLAVKLAPADDRPVAECYILRRAGYAVGEHYVMVTPLGGRKPACYDPHDWDNRTMTVAHEHIINHWDELASGAVIDVQYLLGETKTKKRTERLEP